MVKKSKKMKISTKNEKIWGAMKKMKKIRSGQPENITSQKLHPT